MDRNPFDDRPELSPVPDAEADAGALIVQGAGGNAGPSPAQEGAQASAQRQGSQPQRNGNGEPVARRRWLSFAEAMSLEIKVELVKGLIPACGIGQLWGESGAFKTFIAMMVGYHVSEGLPLCGRRVLKKPVYYLLLEGANGLPKRTRALNIWHETTHVDEKGKPIPLNGVYRFWPYDFNLSKKDAVDALISEIKTNNHDGALVIIDTQSQASIGVDENVAKEITQILGATKRISEEVNGVVLLIHHTGKDTSRKQRGSYAQEANIDFSLEVEKGDDGKSVLLKADKEKDQSKDQVIKFKIEIYEVGVDSDGDIITSCVAVPGAELTVEEKETLANAKNTKKRGHKSDKFSIAKDIFYQAIHQYGKSGNLHESKFREVFYEKFPVSSADSDKAKAAKRRAYNRQLDALIAERVVEKNGEWLRCRDNGNMS